jgi:hypothetical protein
MKTKIVEIEQSPFNRAYFVRLGCGHEITRKRRPLTLEIECPQCGIDLLLQGSATGVSSQIVPSKIAPGW